MQRMSMHVPVKWLAMAEALREAIGIQLGREKKASRSEVLRQALKLGLVQLCKDYDIRVTDEPDQAGSVPDMQEPLFDLSGES